MASMAASYVPKKIELKPKRYHGYAVLLFILGTLLPPLAVAARFGIGRDFWINLVLTLCGYIPGHGHNFYIQNIRNNKTHARTPKWAQRYGLVDTSEIRRKERKSQWASRYNDRLPQSTLEGRPFEDGQEPGSSVDFSTDSHTPRRENGELWRPEDESYYASKDEGSSGGRWRYPANFDDAVIPTGSSKRSKKKEKKDRWARTEDAHSVSEHQSHRRKSRKKKSRSSVAEDSTYSAEINGYPEDPEGGLYSERQSNSGQKAKEHSATDLNHEF